MGDLWKLNPALSHEEQEALVNAPDHLFKQ